MDKSYIDKSNGKCVFRTPFIQSKYSETPGPAAYFIQNKADILSTPYTLVTFCIFIQELSIILLI